MSIRNKLLRILATVFTVCIVNAEVNSQDLLQKEILKLIKENKQLEVDINNLDKLLSAKNQQIASDNLASNELKLNKLNEELTNKQTELAQLKKDLEENKKTYTDNELKIKKLSAEKSALKQQSDKLLKDTRSDSIKLVNYKAAFEHIADSSRELDERIRLHKDSVLILEKGTKSYSEDSAMLENNMTLFRFMYPDEYAAFDKLLSDTAFNIQAVDDYIKKNKLLEKHLNINSKKISFYECRNYINFVLPILQNKTLSLDKKTYREGLKLYANIGVNVSKLTTEQKNKIILLHNDFKDRRPK
jgi:chromosome segregation ATPase